jgi:hypothetical protein
VHPGGLRQVRGRLRPAGQGVGHAQGSDGMQGLVMARPGCLARRCVHGERDPGSRRDRWLTGVLPAGSLRAWCLAGRLAGYCDRAPAAPQHEHDGERDLPGGGRASDAGQLPAAVRDPLGLQIGSISLDGRSRDPDRRLVAPVGVPEDHPQRDPAPGREE